MYIEQINKLQRDGLNYEGFELVLAFPNVNRNSSICKGLQNMGVEIG